MATKSLTKPRAREMEEKNKDKEIDHFPSPPLDFGADRNSRHLSTNPSQAPIRSKHKQKIGAYSGGNGLSKRKQL
jgi:hypothetical protein